MGRIKRNYIYNLAYQLLVLLAPLITAPYLARVLGASNLGIYSYVNSSGSIIATISLLGIYAYGNRQIAYVRDNELELTKTFWEIEITRVILGSIGTIAFVGYVIFNLKYRWFFLLYYPYILAQFVDCSWIFVGLEDMKPAVIKNFVAKVVNIIGIFVFVRSRDDVWKYILLLATTTLIANISVYTQLHKYISKPKGEMKPDIRKIGFHVKGSIFLFLPQIASLFYLQVDKVMLEWITGETSQVSFYDNAEKMIKIPLSIITVMSTVMMPRIANEFVNKNSETIRNLLVKAGRYALLMTFPMMIGMFCIARQLIPWYLGEEFFPTALAMMILSPIVLFNSLSGISGAQYFTSTNQIGILMKAYVSAAVLNICVNAVMIPRYGYAGAAIATLCSSLISVIIQYYYLNRQLDVKILWNYGFKYFVGGTIMGIVIFLVSRDMPARAMTTVIQVAVGCMVYFCYLFFIKDSAFAEVFGKGLKRKKR
jgi:O-antigen/teichoic acid export membrane protein